MGLRPADIPGLQAFGVTALIEDGALRRIKFDGQEVLRLIDYPIRDSDWGTSPTLTDSNRISPDAATFTRTFHTEDGAISGRFQAKIEAADDGARIVAELVLTAQVEVTVNRAGLVVLHPLDGVAGTALTVGHPDGSRQEQSFPAQIAPAQPVRDIASLGHHIGGIEVALALEGEVFEMEDQRNWTDASYKTYCRPLSLPRPYVLGQGDEVRQRIIVTLSRTEAGLRRTTQPLQEDAGMGPAIFLVHEADISDPPHPHPHLSAIRPGGILLRMRSGSGAAPSADGLPSCPITLELVTGTDPVADIAAAKQAMEKAGLSTRRVVALPHAYLSSHQPDGPWPEGPTPMDLVPLLRDAFGDAEIGGGSLTNFTEFNRCPPDPAGIDFATFGTTAIVHAADDLSVIETLEAIPQVIETARVLSGVRSGDLPLCLGLMSIGMRSNPYGAGVVANPLGKRLPMAMEDPRQRTPFAAAFAIAVAAACTRGGVASFAPAMTGGPLGMSNEDGPWPLWHAVAALAALSGAAVTVTGGPATGLVTIRGKGALGIAGVAANLGPGDARLDADAVRIPDRAPADWIERLPAGGPLTLAPMTAAILIGDGA